MNLKEKLIEVANGLESESIRYPRMKTIDVVSMLINIANMEFDATDQCVQIAKDYAEKEAIEFAEWLQQNRWFSFQNGYWYYTFENPTAISNEAYNKNYRKTTSELYQIFKNRENER